MSFIMALSHHRQRASLLILIMLGISFGLGAAASAATNLCHGSIAKSTRRSAEIIEWMAEQENQRRAATPDT